MNYILFDEGRERLLPFTHTRPIAHIRCGIITMRERWEMNLQAKCGILTEGYLQPLSGDSQADDNVFINASVAGDCPLATAIKALEPGQKLMMNGTTVAARTGQVNNLEALTAAIAALQAVFYNGEAFVLRNVWDIFSFNDKAIREDFKLITFNRTSAPIPDHITAVGKEHIFIEEGAKINAGVILNATTGPIYLAKDTEIMEGCMLRGPLALCEHGVIKMGAKIYGATTIGPGSKVGGEISNVVFFSNSNKGHDGFVGNGVIGEWCNLGADTNASNLKNNYDEVKVWSEHENKLVKTGLTFCGLLMGDHSKCGINTMFNTGTVVGVSSNIYGGDFPEKYIPSFSWGGSGNMVTYKFQQAMDTANRMMARRGTKLSDAELKMYEYLFAKATEGREN